MKLILVLVVGIMVSCTYSDANRNIALGGKGAYNSGSFAVTWDNEKSFNDVAWVAMAAVPAIQAVKVAQSADKLSAVQHSNTTKQAINESNNAVKSLDITTKAGVETTKILNPPK